MRATRQINLLRNLIEIPSPSGYETEIANYIKKELLKFMKRTQVSVDFQNNVVVKIEGKSDRTVIFDAHLVKRGVRAFFYEEAGGDIAAKAEADFRKEIRKSRFRWAGQSSISGSRNRRGSRLHRPYVASGSWSI